jgi:hypothetical protein
MFLTTVFSALYPVLSHLPKAIRDCHSACWYNFRRAIRHKRLLSKNLILILEKDGYRQAYIPAMRNTCLT